MCCQIIFSCCDHDFTGWEPDINWQCRETATLLRQLRWLGWLDRWALDTDRSLEHRWRVTTTGHETKHWLRPHLVSDHYSTLSTQYKIHPTILYSWYNDTTHFYTGCFKSWNSEMWSTKKLKALKVATYYLKHPASSTGWIVDEKN